MQEILQYDQYFYHLINGFWVNEVFDMLLPFWREKTNWVPLYLLLIFYLAYRFRGKSLVYFVAVGILIGLSDYSCSELIKKQVQRSRPCREANMPEVPRMLVGCGGGYSFPSSHASNHFALGVFLFLSLGSFFGSWRWLFLFWAFGVAYAQVYVGVHYPLDVIGGAIWGSLLALLVWRLYQLLPDDWRILFTKSKTTFS